MGGENSFPHVPAGWKLETLGEICKRGGGSIQTGPFGSQLHAADYVADGIPSIMPKNIEVNGVVHTDIARISGEDAERLSKYLVEPGDIVYSRRGDVEKCALITEAENGWLCGTGCLRVRLGEASELPPSFMQAYLAQTGVREWIVRHAIGATMPNLNTSILSALPVVVPPSSHVSQVAEIWSVITNKINLNRAINRTLEAMAQAIFKSWFVDFDPVKAKMAARESGTDPTRAAMAVISGKNDTELDAFHQQDPKSYERLRDTAKAFPDALVDSELGMIPEGWEVSTIGDEVTVVGGGTPSTKNPEYWDGGTINWTTPKDLSNRQEKVLLDTERCITSAGLAKISSALLPIDTVLMSSRAPVGYLALAKVPVAVNQGFIAMKCEQSLSPEFVILWAESIMDEIKGRASGTTFAEISKKSFRIIPVIVPSGNVLSIFSDIIGEYYRHVAKNIRENEILIQSRKALLPELLSGMAATYVQHSEELQG